MNKQGTVVRWDGAKAFGFIRSPPTSADIFFHIRDYKGDRPPHDGMVVDFEEIHVGGKGPRAMAVRSHHSAPQRPINRRPEEQRSHQRGARKTARNTAHARQDPASGVIWSLLAIWLALLLWGIFKGQLAWTVLPAAAALNGVTYLAYWKDKSAAQSGAWRTPESTLHMLALAGGWPAARWAQRRLRHKSSKTAFQVVYGATVLLNLAGLLAWVAGLVP